MAKRHRTATLSPAGPRAATRCVLGIMAGTSADGIDAACIRVNGTGEAMRVRLLGHHHRPFAPALRRRLLAAMAPAATTTQEITRLHADLGDAFAQAAADAISAAPSAERPTLIGLAGQTICHIPNARPGRTATLQLGEPARVAARTGLPTVAEFRQSDVAAGGQGAPLVPWTDWLLFRHPSIGRAIQNIGGIGNVTWIPPGARTDDVIAFDTGPGNMVIDALVAHVTGGRRRMDRNGARAARGRVLHQVLDQWLKHPFFRRKPPKSTGRETFGRDFVNSQIEPLTAASRSPDDWIATAAAFTARSIARAYRRFLPPWQGRQPAPQNRGIRPARTAPGPSPSRSTPPNIDDRPPPIELIVAGGGAHNPTLMAMLAAELPGLTVRTIDAFEIPPQAKEAVSFALLAAACIDRSPANLPRVTGATHPAVLGRILQP